MPDGFVDVYKVPTIEWSTIMPVIGVIVIGLMALIIEMVWRKKSSGLIVGTSIAGLLTTGALTAFQLTAPDSTTFAGMVLQDRFGTVMQLLMILSCVLTLLFSDGYLKEKNISFGEFYPLIIWSTAGGMLMVSSTNLLMIFLGLEILSISLYVLAGLSRNEAKSEESALKYFLLGSFASAFLLYGIALIYGATGSLYLETIAAAWATNSPEVKGLLLMGSALALVGLAFKSAFVPFHQWTPDVYQGAPTNVSAFMAAGSKIAALGALYRFLDASMVLKEYWMPVLFWIAILTMTVGNLVACVQKDAKRILGYSSIAHAGYILVALLARFSMPDKIGFTTLLYYLLAYSLMTIGAFAVLTVATKSGKEGTKLQDLNGLWRRNPAAAVALVIFMVSLIGIPPSAGFVGKFMVFRDAVTAGLVPLAIVLGVNSAISVYYYLSIALAAFVNETTDEEAPTSGMSPGLRAATTICAVGVIAITVFYTQVTDTLTHDDNGISQIQQIPDAPAPADRP